MFDLARKAMLMGIGALSMTKEAVENVVEELVKKGELTQQEGKKLADEVLERGRKEQARIQEAVEKAVVKVITDAGVATKADLERIEARVAALEQDLKSCG
jgi:poly(hydroxyalkanoate) granule-associated protein